RALAIAPRRVRTRWGNSALSQRICRLQETVPHANNRRVRRPEVLATAVDDAVPVGAPLAPFHRVVLHGDPTPHPGPAGAIGRLLSLQRAIDAEVVCGIDRVAEAAMPVGRVRQRAVAAVVPS